MSLKMGYVRSKTRSLGQILEKLCVCSKGHIFSQIILKPGQNVCLDKMSDYFENRSRGVKSKVTRLNLRKILFSFRGHNISPVIMKLGQNVCLDEILDEFENGSCGVKN